MWCDVMNIIVLYSRVYTQFLLIEFFFLWIAVSVITTNTQIVVWTKWQKTFLWLTNWSNKLPTTTHVVVFIYITCLLFRHFCCSFHWVAIIDILTSIDKGENKVWSDKNLKIYWVRLIFTAAIKLLSAKF